VQRICIKKDELYSAIYRNRNNRLFWESYETYKYGVGTMKVVHTVRKVLRRVKPRHNSDINVYTTSNVASNTSLLHL
jgi:hypothetical protein